MDERELVIRQGRYRLHVRFHKNGGSLLNAPESGQMTRRVREDIACRAEYTLMHGNRVPLHTVTDSAAAEYDTKEEKNENNSYHSRKDKEKYLRDAIAEYSKRLSRYCKLEVIEVADEKTPDQASETVEDNIRAKEGERLMKYIRDDMYVITLEIGGKMLSSEEFAEKIETLGVQGKSSIAFVIVRLDRSWERGAKKVGLCAQFLEDDISTSVDEGDTAGTGVSGVSDHEWRAVS